MNLADYRSMPPHENLGLTEALNELVGERHFVNVTVRKVERVAIFTFSLAMDIPVAVARSGMRHF